MPVNILNLPAYVILKVKETDHDYHIHAETTQGAAQCVACQGDNIVGYGRNEVFIKDLPMHGKRVGIYIKGRRFRCRDCGRTFMEKLPAVNGNRNMTDRLVSYIGKQSLGRTFTSIADDVGTSEGTVRSIFRDYINELEKTVRFETPQWMGIDEVHIIKKPRAVISNIKENTIVNLLPDRTKRTVSKYLHHLDGKEDVRYIAMDMWNPYRDAVRDVLPDARIIVDKFHVVRMANDALEKVRKSLRSSLSPKERRNLMHDRFILLKRRKDLTAKDEPLLSSWLDTYGSLRTAYRLKEGFYDIWDASEDKEEALARYNAWVKGITPDVSYAFEPLVTAVSNWQDEIFSYFDHRITNAYTEALNGLIKVMDRLGRGYSFEALRAKILFTGSLHKVKKPVLRRVSNEFATFCVGGSPDNRHELTNYGVDIYTLAQHIETGEL